MKPIVMYCIQWIINTVANFSSVMHDSLNSVISFLLISTPVFCPNNMFQIL